jgi:hypothetical protein
MANRKKNPVKRLNVTETIYALLGWLTTRDQPVILSAHHDASVPAKLVGAFVDENRLPATRPNKIKLQVPKHLDHLTNDYPKDMVMKRLTTGEAYDAIRNLFRTFEHADQDAILAQVLIDLKRSRENKLKHANASVLDYQEHQSQVQEHVWSLENVIRGNFAVLKPLIYDQPAAKQADNDLKKEARR